MVSACLVDTDVLIDHLRGARPFDLPEGASAAYSVITRAELYAGRRAAEQPIEALLGHMVELGISPAVANRAGAIRRTVGIALADALIGATALDSGRILMTRNREHFERIDGLALAAD